MNTLLNAAVLMTLFAASSAAQWPPHPTPGVLKLPDGKPNLNAPAPRTADGKPDLSGLWENFRPGGQRGEGQRGEGQRGEGQRGAAAPAPAPAAQAPAASAPAAPAGPPLASFRDAGSGIQGGLPLQPWAADLVKKRMADNSKDNPDAHCLPMGFMQFHMHPQPRKIIQTPGLVLIVYEANNGLRQIFTDGRPLPKNDPQPFWYGYSIGKWEGDTLVVETTGLRDGGWLDINGNPLTDAAKVTERFRRVNYGNLEIDITVDDPKAYTKPWTVRVNQRVMVDTDLIEFICLENQRFSPK